jgi:hypothetical protein
MLRNRWFKRLTALWAQSAQAFAVGLLLHSSLWLAAPVAAAERYYDAAFRAEIKPRRTTVLVELTLTGERLPSRIEFHIDPARHRSFAAKDPLKTADNVVTWSPTGKQARITYEFLATHERSPRYARSLLATGRSFGADKGALYS